MPPEPEPILNTCPECSQVIDVTQIPPYSKIECPHCGEAMRARTRFEHFTITAELGEGGMSRVFRAEDSALGREVALKILHLHFGDHPELIRQFEREARVTASINHPNVVEVYSVGQDQGHFYIAMELLETESLDDQIATGPIRETAALRVIHEVTQGLAATFQYDLIHRDIKPGNILLDQTGTAKLVDFGLALIQGSDEDLSEMWATPFYVPPEKLRGQPDDFRGDIYSLGATLFHALAGQPPHAAETHSIAELIEIKAQPANLKAVAPKLKGPTIQLVNRMMAQRPEDRFASYQELLDAIAATREAVDPDYEIPGKEAGFPLWAKLVSASVALAFVGGLTALVWPKDNGGEDLGISGGAGGSSELVMSAREAALLRQLDTARAAYAGGNREQAMELFRGLTESDAARADLRAWSAFHLGLDALIQEGDAGTADAHFESGAGYAGTALPELGRDLRSLTGNDPPPDGEVSTTSAEMKSLADLVFGLKAWQRAEFGPADERLTRFLSGSYEADFSWMEQHKAHCQSIQADAAVLAAASPALPETEDVATLQAAAAAWRTSREQLRFEPGKKILTARIDAANRKIEDIRKREMETARLRDESQLRAARERSAPFGESRAFAEAAALWRDLETETDWARKQAISTAEAWSRADAFFTEFTGSLSTFRYQGEILRTEGRPFTARVVSATPDTLIVDLGFGNTKLDMKSVSNEGILRIAQATLLVDASRENREGAAFFAWFTAQVSEANKLAFDLDTLAGFSRRWEAVTLPEEFR